VLCTFTSGPDTSILVLPFKRARRSRLYASPEMASIFHIMIAWLSTGNELPRDDTKGVEENCYIATRYCSNVKKCTINITF
jgi:hypothetical protein